MSYIIPRRISSYLKRLELSYLNDNENGAILEVIRNGSFKVYEKTSHDNWNGGTYGHTVSFFLPEESMKKIGNLKAQTMMAKRISEDLNLCSQSVPDEFIDNVSIDLFDEFNPECLTASPSIGGITISAEGLSMWTHGYIRVFISHKAEYKREVGELKDRLEAFGISCFVAHEAIEPMQAWEDEIRKALFSMEVLLVFLTDDFQNSKWTDQEVGVAIGRGIPIIPLKLQTKNPHGFIAKIQAVSGAINNIEEAVTTIRKTIVEKIDRDGRLKAAAIESFANSKSYDDARDRFIILKEYKKFNEDEISRIIEAYNFNSQLYGAIYLDNRNRRFLNFLEEVSGRKYYIVDAEVKIAQTEMANDIPF